MSTNQYGQGASHAKDAQTGSHVPVSVQKAVPESVERSLPDSIHNTGDQPNVSHATGKSIIPEAIQKLAPEGLERALPNSIHDTSGLTPKK